MELSFTELKQKDVINLIDGKHLGRVCDLTFSFPESKVLGFTVTGCKGFRFSKQEVFLPINTVVKIGKDAVLVKFGKEEDCHEKPKCKPKPCPPPCPPNPCPPKPCPPQCPPYPNDRRSYDEYE